MNSIAFIAANALLFMSLLLVIGAPVLLATEKQETWRTGRSRRSIQFIEIGSALWLVLLLVNTGISFLAV